MITDLPLRARFPGCHQCSYFGTGPASVCMACAGRRLERPTARACPVCGQRTRLGGLCANELCRCPQRRIGRIHAIAYHTGPLRRAIYDYKYRDVQSWAVIFGRLLLAWLDETLLGDPPDLIVANPSFSGPGGQRFAHTEAVIEAAAREAAAREAAGREATCETAAREAAGREAAGREATSGTAAPEATGCETVHLGTRPRWRLDTETPRAIVKTAATLRSADMQAWSKRASATELREALLVPDSARISGRYVLVYDDICTTGGQLDAVAGRLLDEGDAARVEAVVLARAPWR